MVPNDDDDDDDERGISCEKTFLVRRRTKTQKYKHARLCTSVEDENRKQDKKTRHKDQNKVNE